MAANRPRRTIVAVDDADDIGIELDSDKYTVITTGDQVDAQVNNTQPDLQVLV